MSEEAPNLSLKADLNDGELVAGLAAMAEKVKATETGINVATKTAAEERIAISERAQLKELALIRDRDIAGARQFNDQFQRFKYIENAKTEYNKGVLNIRFKDEGNLNKLLEIEDERHTAFIESNAVREAGFPLTAFQKMIGKLEGVLQVATGIKLKAIHEIAAGFAATGNFSNAPLGGLSSLAGAGGGAEVEALAAKRAAMAGVTDEAVAGGAAMGGFGASMSRVIPVIGGVVIGLGAAAMAIKHTMTVAEEFREAQEGLESSLKTSGRSIPLERLKQYAEAISQTTKFNVAQAESAESVLITTRHLTNDELPKWIHVTAEIAAKGKKSMEEVSHAISKALQAPENAGRALAQADIKLTAQEQATFKELAKNGDSLAAREKIFDMLSKKTGTFAEDTVHSTTIVGHQWQDLEAKIGTSALHILDSIASIFVSDPKKEVRAVSDAQKEIEDREVQAIYLRFQHGRQMTQQQLAARDAAVKAYYDKGGGEYTLFMENQKKMEDAEAAAIKRKYQKAGGRNSLYFATDADKAAAEKAVTAYWAGVTDADKTAWDAFQKDKAARAKQTSKTTIEDQEGAAGKKTKGVDKPFSLDSFFDNKSVEDADKAVKMAGDAADKAGKEVNDAIEKANAEKVAKGKKLFEDLDKLRKENTEREKKAAEEEIKIREATFEAAHHLTDSLFSLAEAGAGKSKAAKSEVKALQIGEAIANVAFAETKVFADPKTPIGPWTWVEAAAIGAAGAASIAKIASAESGGWINGPRHSGGGVMINAEGGERVISRIDVDRMGGRDGVDRAIAGRNGGGTVYSPTHNITIHAVPGMSGEDIGREVSRQISLHDAVMFQKTSRAANAYNGLVTA